MKAVNDAEKSQQPDNSCNSKLTETNIPGKDCHSQRKECKAIKEVKRKIYNHSDTCLEKVYKFTETTGPDCIFTSKENYGPRYVVCLLNSRTEGAGIK